MLGLSDFIIFGFNLVMWYNVMLMLGFTNEEIKDKIKHDIAELTWWLLHKVSIVQLKTHKYIIQPLEYYVYQPIQHFLSTQNIHYKIVFVESGREILKVKSKSHIPENIEFDFILYYLNSFNTLVFENISDIPDIDFIDTKCLKSNVKFMCCQMIAEVGEERIKKVFELDEFLSRNNDILSSDFVKWYCYKHFPREDWIKTFNFVDYTIDVIDNNVNEFKIKNNQLLTIRKDDCKVYTCFTLFKKTTEDVIIKDEIVSLSSDDGKDGDFIKVSNDVDCVEVDVNSNENETETGTDVGSLSQEQLKNIWESSKAKSE